MRSESKRLRSAFFLNSALFLGSIFLGVLLVEIFLRFQYPQVDEVDRMFEFDEELGWRFVSNKEGTIVYPGESRLRLRTNSWGFRDDGFDKLKDRRIMVIGDSFVSNIAVDASSVFTEIMERELDGVSVLNFGVNGYSNVQELLLLERYLGRVKPDLVVCVLYVRNDFDENLGKYWFYPRPIAQIVDGDLSILRLGEGDDEHSSPFRFPASGGRFHVVEFGKNVISYAKLKISKDYSASPHAPPELYINKKDLSGDMIGKFEVACRLMLEMNVFCEERGARFLVVIAPTIVQSDEDYWEFALKSYGADSEQYDRSLLNRSLIQFFESKGVLALDLFPSMDREYKWGGAPYNRLEEHWNARGNEIVAAELLEFIRSNSLLID